MQPQSRFFCYLDKIVCPQFAIFNPSLVISIGNSRVHLMSNSTDYPSFIFNQKIKCSIPAESEFGEKVNFVKFEVFENSNNEIAAKKIGFSALKGTQKLVIKSANGDFLEIHFKASVETQKAEPEWFSEIDASITNFNSSGIDDDEDEDEDDMVNAQKQRNTFSMPRPNKSFYMNAHAKTLNIPSSMKNDKKAEQEISRINSNPITTPEVKFMIPTINPYNNPNTQSSPSSAEDSNKSSQIPKLNGFQPININKFSMVTRIQSSTFNNSDLFGTNDNDDALKIQRRQKTQSFSINIPPFASTLLHNPEIDKTKHRHSQGVIENAYLQEEESDEEEDKLDDEMPKKNEHHELSDIELYVKAKLEVFFTSAQDKTGYDIGTELIKLSSRTLTLNQKYVILMLEDGFNKINSKNLAFRYFNCLYSIYLAVFSNRKLRKYIKRIIKILISKTYKGISAHYIKAVIAALQKGPSSAEFSSSISQISSLRKQFPEESGEIFCEKIFECLDCNLCNLMITKMFFNTYSEVANANSNIAALETIGNIKLTRLKQAFQTIINRNDVIISPNNIKSKAPLLNSTFIFYLLSIVKSDRSNQNVLTFESLQQFGLSANVNFKDPIENCLLKIKKLRLPRHCKNLEFH